MPAFLQERLPSTWRMLQCYRWLFGTLLLIAAFLSVAHQLYTGWHWPLWKSLPVALLAAFLTYSLTILFIYKIVRERLERKTRAAWMRAVLLAVMMCYFYFGFPALKELFRKDVRGLFRMG